MSCSFHEACDAKIAKNYETKNKSCDTLSTGILNKKAIGIFACSTNRCECLSPRSKCTATLVRHDDVVQRMLLITDDLLVV